MNFLWIFPVLALLFAGVAVFLFQGRERERRRAAQAEAYVESVREQLAERKELREKLDEAVFSRHEAEKRVELMQQKMADLDTRMKDWETQREESVKAAKAAILEAGGHMSNKLLEDHKREQEASKKEQELRLKQTTESLLVQVTSITQSVSTLREQTQDTQKRMETVWRALSSPTGAGQLAEVGLENTLKNLGLEANRDFIMQYALTDKDSGNRLRPDAILFLPQDVVIVVDSKASKFMLELAEAETDEHRAASLERLRQTMNKHLKDLASKDYAAAVQNQSRASGHSAQMRVMLNVMYLPSDAALERIKQADGEFLEKAEKAGIILAAPTSLHGLFTLAKLQIASSKQAENYDKIILHIETLIENTVTMLGYADKIGVNIKRAADEFNRMAASANRRLLPRMKQLAGMGVKLRNKALPAPIQTYDMRRLDDMLTIDMEAEEEPMALPPALESAG